MLLLAALVILIVNIATFVAFGVDKQRAIAGARRLREADLLGLAIIGGTPAAFLARRHFRHKTRKQPFSTMLAVVALMQAGAIAGAGWSVIEVGLQA